jgi:hypothetical protein
MRICNKKQDARTLKDLPAQVAAIMPGAMHVPAAAVGHRQVALVADQNETATNIKASLLGRLFI